MTRFPAITLWPNTPVNWPGRSPICSIHQLLDQLSDSFAWREVRCPGVI